MSTETDISALYREFTDALTEVLAENAVGLARRGLRGRALPSRSTLDIANMHIFWRWRPHSRIGKPCKMSVARSGLAVRTMPHVDKWRV
jgi:hypothetical protein